MFTPYFQTPVFARMYLDLSKYPNYYSHILNYGPGLIAPFTPVNQSHRLLVDSYYWRQKPFDKNGNYRIRKCFVSDRVVYFDTTGVSQVENNPVIELWNTINEQFEALSPVIELFDHPREVIFDESVQKFAFSQT